MCCGYSLEVPGNLLLISTHNIYVLMRTDKKSSLGHRFFIFCFTDFFHNKLVSEDEIVVFPSILIQLENGPNEFYFTN